MVFVLEEFLVLRGVSYIYSILLDSVYLLLIDVRVEREGFLGELFKIGGEDG